MLALVLAELLAWSLSIPGSPEVDLMHDVIGLAIADAVAALVACASAAGIQPVISDLLLEGVVEVLLGLADSHVTCWLGDCALVVVGLVVHLHLLLTEERTAKHRVATASAQHCELGLLGGSLSFTCSTVNVCIGVFCIGTIGVQLL